MHAFKGSFAFSPNRFAEQWLWFFKNEEDDINVNSQTKVFPCRDIEKESLGNSSLPQQLRTKSVT